MRRSALLRGHLGRGAAIVLLAWIATPATVTGQDDVDPVERLVAATAHLPLYGPRELALTPERLTPSRVIKRPVGAYLDSIFRPDVQVIVGLERSIATRWIDDSPTLDHEGFWVRWRANTHNQIDEAWIDFETMGLKRTVAGYRSLTWYEEGRVVEVSIPADSQPSRREMPAPDRPYYSNVTLPYVFAAMNVPTGTSFKLEGFSTSSGRVFPIQVDVIGSTSYADAAGQPLRVLQIESRSPSSHITWYIDPERAPHYLGSVWRTLNADGSVATVAEERVVDWSLYDRDVYGDRTRSPTPGG